MSSGLRVGTGSTIEFVEEPGVPGCRVIEG